MGGGKGGKGGRGGRGGRGGSGGFNPYGGGGGGGGGPEGPEALCVLHELQRPAADEVRRGQMLELRPQSRGLAAVDSKKRTVGYVDQDCASRLNLVGAHRVRVVAVTSESDGRVFSIEVESVAGT